MRPKGVVPHNAEALWKTNGSVLSIVLVREKAVTRSVVITLLILIIVPALTPTSGNVPGREVTVTIVKESIVAGVAEYHPVKVAIHLLIVPLIALIPMSLPVLPLPVTPKLVWVIVDNIALVVCPMIAVVPTMSVSVKLVSAPAVVNAPVLNQTIVAVLPISVPIKPVKVLAVNVPVN